MSNTIEELRAQGKEFLSSLRDRSSLTRGFFKETAPRLLKGYLNEQLHAMSNAEVYNYLKGDIWSTAPENQKQFLMSYKPWPLDWLTVEWIRDVVALTHPAVAAAIDSSPMLKESLSENIRTISSHLSS